MLELALIEDSWQNQLINQSHNLLDPKYIIDNTLIILFYFFKSVFI